MFRAVLFDLDGTLLPIDMDVFMKEYFRTVSAKFIHLISPETLVNAILSGIKAMVEDSDPEKTNKEVFWSCFLSHIGLPYEIVAPVFEEFYAKDFANLKSCSSANPYARPLLNLLFENGCQVVIATNPIFPESAIVERLRWTCIDGLPYSLVTTYENMHFCKPKFKYYEEIIRYLGVDPGECLMVGNDVREDLVARKLGIKTFLVEDWLLNSNELPIETDYRGSFQDLVSFLRRKTCTAVKSCLF